MIRILIKNYFNYNFNYNFNYSYNYNLIALVLKFFQQKDYFFFQGSNNLTKELLDRLQSRRQIYLIVGTYKCKIVARFVVCSRLSQEKDIVFAWNEISDQATEILQEKFEKPMKNIVKSTDDIAIRIENLN